MCRQVSESKRAFIDFPQVMGDLETELPSSSAVDDDAPFQRGGRHKCSNTCNASLAATMAFHFQSLQLFRGLDQCLRIDLDSRFVAAHKLDQQGVDLLFQPVDCCCPIDLKYVDEVIGTASQVALEPGVGSQAPEPTEALRGCADVCVSAANGRNRSSLSLRLPKSTGVSKVANIISCAQKVCTSRSALLSHIVVRSAALMATAG